MNSLERHCSCKTVILRCLTLSPKNMQEVVVLDFNDLVKKEANLSEMIAKAFGDSQDCLGLCFVKNVPNLLPLRERLLKSASKLAHLPMQDLDAITHPESLYNFGWSHGKEVMNGKPDFAKGSFYNNPVFNSPACITTEFQKKYPGYGYDNIWPDAMPELEAYFMELAQLIISVGKLVAFHCDKYLNQAHPDLPISFLQNMIETSMIHKARLLHYFPIPKEVAVPSPDGSNMDSWCGIHVDHSVLTGLTSALYVDESSPSFHEIEKSDPKVQEALKDAGLYIKNRFDQFTQAKIPADCLAFQIGESAQIASRGSLVATPHLVRGAAYPNMARNTFAVFMQPNVEHELKPGYNFAQFTDDVFKRHYKEAM
jgi:isopenicillin N synthase-like dioxygenase